MLLAGVALTAIVSVALLAQMRHVAADPIALVPVFQGADTLLRPDYREWKVVDATAHSEQHPFGRAYISPAAYREFAQTGTFPEGTVMILESSGTSVSLLASVKDSSRF